MKVANIAFPVSGMELFQKNIYSENIQAFEAMYALKKKTDGDVVTKKDTEIGESLFTEMRGYLIFGRIFGIVPVSGVVHSTNHSNLHFKVFSAPMIASLVCCILVGFTSILAIIDSMGYSKHNALEIAKSIQGTIFKVWGLFCYLYFLLRANAFINIFRDLERASFFYPIRDPKLHRDIIIFSSIIFLFAAAESVLIHLEYFAQFDTINSMPLNHNQTSNSTLETYYVRSHTHWKKFLGYNPFFAILAFVAHKLVVICWNYVDLLLIIFSRALYFKFKGLCQVAEENLEIYSKSSDTKPYSLADRLTWTHIARDHDTLCSLLESFEKFMSPLIFGSYTTNIYYICMQLIDGLTPEKIDHSLVHAIFTPVSFLLLILRVFLLSTTAAKVNTFAHDIGNTLKKCPIEVYDEEVQRVDKHVTSGPDIGLSGLGCFVVTKPFILSILNVVFTVEIVLLQGLSSTGPETCSTPPR